MLKFCSVFLLFTASGYFLYPFLFTESNKSAHVEKIDQQQKKIKPTASTTALSDPVPAKNSIKPDADNYNRANEFFLNKKAAPVVTSDFDVAQWISTYAKKEDLQGRKLSWPQPYAGGKGFTWWSPNDVDTAKRFKTPLGPLGIVVTPINEVWMKHKSFKDYYPAALKDSDGRLLTNGLLITDIIKGAPAEGLLQVGDIIYRIDDTALEDAEHIAPNTPWIVKNTRSLRIHTGWLIDRAEAVGHINLKILRGIGPGSHAAVEPTRRKFQALPSLELAQPSGTQTTPTILNKDTPEASVSCELDGAQFLRLEVSAPLGKAQAWINWIHPKLLLNDGSEIKLTEESWLSATTGYAVIRIGKNLSNKDVTYHGAVTDDVIGTHTKSVIIYKLPKNAKSAQAICQLARGNAQVSASLTTCNAIAFSQSLANETQQIRFTAPAGGAQVTVINPRLQSPAEGLTPIVVMGLKHTKYKDGSFVLAPTAKEDASCVISMPHIVDAKIVGQVIVENSPSKTSKQPLIIESLSGKSALDHLQKFSKDITIPLKKIGSYPYDFASDSPKTKAVTKMTAAWILAQQHSDGSWPRYGGFCTNGIDTAICMLGLLATGDDAYLPAVKRAAHFLAVDCKYGKWVTNRSMAVIALSEYWLRTQDDSIVEALKFHNNQLVDFLYADSTVGHGENPGYGDGSVNYGGAHLALAWALAEKTPAGGKPKLLRRMLERVQEMSPGGHVPYGRNGDSKFDGKLSTAYSAGARTGVYLAAAKLTGGPSYFISQAGKHLGEYNLGAGDQGHSTKSFSLFGTTIALATARPDVYAEHLRRHGWAITSNRGFNGGFHWGSDPIEYMGAESVMHDLYRASVYLILLNADKKSLAITGNPKHQAKKSFALPKLAAQDGKLYRSWYSRWAIAEALVMQSRNPVPSALKSALDDIHDLKGKAGKDMRKQILGIIKTSLPNILPQIKNMNLKKNVRSHILENLYGVNTNVRITETLNKEKQPTALKLHIETHIPLAGLITKNDKITPFVTRVKINNAQGEKWLKKTLTFDATEQSKIDWRAQRIHSSFDIPLPPKNAKKQLVAGIGTKVGGFTILRSMKLNWPLTKLDYSTIKVPGTITRSFLRHTFIFKTLAGREIPCINGQITLPLPVLMNDRIEIAHSYSGTTPLPEGAKALFHLSHDLNRIIPVEIWGASKVVYNEAPIADIQWNEKPLNLEDLSDYKKETAFMVPPSSEITQSLTINLKKPSVVKNLFYKTEERPELNLIFVEAMTPDGWKIIAYTGHQATLIRLNAIKTQKIKLTFSTIKKTVKLTEVHLYK